MLERAAQEHIRHRTGLPQLQREHTSGLSCQNCGGWPSQLMPALSKDQAVHICGCVYTKSCTYRGACCIALACSLQICSSHIIH